MAPAVAKRAIDRLGEPDSRIGTSAKSQNINVALSEKDPAKYLAAGVFRIYFSSGRRPQTVVGPAITQPGTGSAKPILAALVPPTLMAWQYVTGDGRQASWPFYESTCRRYR